MLYVEDTDFFLISVGLASACSVGEPGLSASDPNGKSTLAFSHCFYLKYFTLHIYLFVGW